MEDTTRFSRRLGDHARAGDDANLRQAAQSATPLIQHHLQMAEQLRGAVGGS
jgi:hypothetical protein